MNRTKGRSSVAPRLLSFVQAAAKHATNLGAHFALASLTPRFPVFWLRGTARHSRRQATLLVAGKEPWVSYLPGRFFAGEPARELIGRASIWTLPGLLRHLRSSADLTIARVDRISSLLFFRGGSYLRVPEWIGSVLKVPEDPAAYIRLNSNRREDVRHARRHRLQPVVSHSDADLDSFYDTMYVPYIRRRHGKQAALARRTHYRGLFRRGGILWIERDGERVAGMLFAVFHRTFYSVALGTADGESQPRHQGALAATYLHGLEVARQHGCTRIDYRGSRPSLHDGVLRYKRKWGITLRELHGNYFDLLVHWNRFDGVVADFLSHTSLIFREQGGFSAIHALNAVQPATEADALKARQSLWIDGLQRLYLFSPGGWNTAGAIPSDINLLEPRTISKLTSWGTQ